MNLKLIIISIFTVLLIYLVYKLFNRNKSKTKSKNEPLENNIEPLTPKNPEEKYKQQIANNDPMGYYNLGDYYYSLSKSDNDPILIEAVRNYQNAANSGIIDALLPLADIYNFCKVPMGNKDTAFVLYTKLIRNSPNKETKVKANLRLMELNKEETANAINMRTIELPRRRQITDIDGVLNTSLAWSGIKSKCCTEPSLTKIDSQTSGIFLS